MGPPDSGQKIGRKAGLPGRGGTPSPGEEREEEIRQEKSTEGLTDTASDRESGKEEGEKVGKGICEIFCQGDTWGNEGLTTHGRKIQSFSPHRVICYDL